MADVFILDIIRICKGLTEWTLWTQVAANTDFIVFIERFILLYFRENTENILDRLSLYLPVKILQSFAHHSIRP